MLLLVAFATTAIQSPISQARATVRIVRPIRISKETWSELPPKRRREVVAVRDGQRVKLRLLEFE